MNDTLIEYLYAHAAESPEALAASLRGRFDIREKRQETPEPPVPAVGQTWRNRRSDRLVRITSAPAKRVHFNGRTYASGDIGWEAITGRGPKTGSGWGLYWTDRFEYVETTR